MARQVMRVRGDAQFRRNMRKLAANLKGNQVDPIMKSALEPMRQDTESNAMTLRDVGNPIGGHLDQGVVTARIKPKSPYIREWWVSFAKRARQIAHLVEFGTRPHDQPRRGIFHPGARPKPFFTPAFEANKGGTVQRLGQGVWALIRRGAATLPKTPGRR